MLPLFAHALGNSAVIFNYKQPIHTLSPYLINEKPSTATPLTISVTATTSRLNISRRPRALVKNGGREDMGLGSSAVWCPHPDPLPPGEGKGKCDGD